MKYQKPKMFEPSEEEKRRAAEYIAKHLSPNKAIILDNGEQVRGSRGEMKINTEPKDD